MRCMKKLLLFVTLVLLCTQSYAGHNIIGVYYNSNGIRLEVSEDKFLMLSTTEMTDSTPVIYADASYVWVNDNFIRLVQPSVKSQIDEGVRVAQSKDESVKDSILVTLSLPNIRTTGDITTNVMAIFIKDLNSYWAGREPWWKTYELAWTEDKDYGSVMIPLYPDLPVNFEIIISPFKKKSLPVDSESGYYSSFTSYSYKLKWRNEDEINRIDITIPYIDNYFFGRYYVNGDYVRIDGDKLYWRGRVFEKSTAPEDIEYIEKKKSTAIK